MESVKVTRTTKEALSQLSHLERRPEEAIVADMLETYQSALLKARLQTVQVQPLPSPEEDPEMAEWDRINQLVHEGRTSQSSA